MNALRYHHPFGDEASALELPQIAPTASAPGWLMTAALVVIAYKVGVSRGRKHGDPLPGFGALAGSYFGLRAMDALFKGIL